MVKNPPASGDTKAAGSIPESGRSPVVGNSNPLQYSYLENSTGRGTRQATVHGAAKKSDMTEHTTDQDKQLLDGPHFLSSVNKQQD